MNYRHVVDKTSINTVRILGVDIADINMSMLVDFTCKYIKQLSGDYICVANVHTTVTAFENEGYKMIQNSGVMAIPDGGPLAVVGRKRGAKIISRTTGPDYMEEIIKISSRYGYKHFFYGGTEYTLEKIRNKINTKYPMTNIVGMYSPPFRSLDGEEDKCITSMINEASPDFIWVSLGAPKQEIWMANHQGQVKGLMVGVGAAFDFFAENKKRAPKWMKETNLEWLYRLAQDPKRLFKRYLITNTKFIWNAIIRKK